MTWLSSNMIAIENMALSVEVLGPCLVGRLIFPTSEHIYLAIEWWNCIFSNTFGVFMSKRRRWPCINSPSVSRIYNGLTRHHRFSSYNLDKHYSYELKTAENITDNFGNLCLNITPTHFILLFRKVHKIYTNLSEWIILILLSVPNLRSNAPRIRTERWVNN